MDKYLGPVHQTLTLAVTGGKGGVGKTLFALKFCRELAKLGSRVLLIDCDFNLSNTGIKIGLGINERFEKFVKGEIPLKETLYKFDDFHLLVGAHGQESLFERDFRYDVFLIQLIQSVSKDYDVIVLDSPAGLLKETTNLGAFCDQRIFVVGPDISSITDAYSLMKIMRLHYGIKENHVVLNRTDSVEESKRIMNALSGTAESYLGVRTIWSGDIPNISASPSSVDKIFLSNEDSPFQRKFIKIIEKYSDSYLRGVPTHEVLGS